MVPSIRFERDDPRPVGFVDEVSPSHLAAVKEAFSGIAQAINDSATVAPRQISVRFGSVRYMPALPFDLYGFHVPHVSDAGEFVDEIGEGRDLNYAVDANHAVEVQREIGLLFLYQLINRQAALSN